MKLIIEIPDKMYKTVQDGTYCGSLFEELKNGITVEQCVDCIRRQDVEDAIYDYSRSCDVNYAQIMEFIDKLPSVTPQQKMGRWIKTPKAVMGEGYMWYCDKCEHKVYQDSSKPYPSEKYCPNCGQPKMQEGEG